MDATTATLFALTAENADINARECAHGQVSGNNDLELRSFGSLQQGSVLQTTETGIDGSHRLMPREMQS